MQSITSDHEFDPTCFDSSMTLVETENLMDSEVENAKQQKKSNVENNKKRKSDLDIEGLQVENDYNVKKMRDTR